MLVVDDYSPQCWNDVAAILDAGLNRLILHGPPGTGKTMGGLTLGNVAGGAYRLECTEDMTQFDIVGGFMPAGEAEWKYKDGAAIKAWQGDGIEVGGRLVIDEIDKASGDVLALLLAMTDSDESCLWEHPGTGRKLRPRTGYSVVMTTNLEDVNQLEPALRDRFPAAVYIDQPHPDAIAALPGKFQRYAIQTTGEISIRSWQAIARLEKAVGVDEALRLVVGGDKAKQFADDLRVDAVA